MEEYLKKRMEKEKIYFQYELNKFIKDFIDEEKILSRSGIWKMGWMISELRRIMEERGVIFPHHLLAETYYEIAEK